MQTVELTTSECRKTIRDYYLADEHKVISELIASAQISQGDRDAISERAAQLVRSVRSNSNPTMMEKFKPARM